MTMTVFRVPVRKSALVALAVTLAIFLTGLRGLPGITKKVQKSMDTTQRNVSSYAPPSEIQHWDVLISTYMRSGSSFLGKMLGFRNDSFYWYEPLWKNNIWRFFRDDGKMCGYIRPNCDDSIFADRLNNSLQFLNDFYKCILKPHCNRIHEGMHAKYSFVGHSWEVFRQCRSSHKSMAECLSKLEQVCQNLTHRVTKVLRLDFSYAARLLPSSPRLKAVLLLRDPRGVINSHLHTKWFPMNENRTQSLEDDVKVLCSRMDRDIKAANLLMSRFPGRVKIIQYEDFGDPSRMLELMYPFFGMDASRRPGTPTLKINNSKTTRDLFSYRTSLRWQTVQTLDKYCRNVYRELGLVQYRDEIHLRDLSQSPIISTLPYSFD